MFFREFNQHATPPTVVTGGLSEYNYRMAKMPVFRVGSRHHERLSFNVDINGKKGKGNVVLLKSDSMSDLCTIS